MLIEQLPIILLGFTLGMMHALDADHVMAVSSLSNQKPSLRRTVLFSANWAIGHGGVLVVSGLLLFGLGIALPDALIHVAEMSVGVLLIVLGLYSFWQFRQQKLVITKHRHGDVEHSHWHHDEHGKNVEQAATKDGHLPVMVGVLHGLAGSAPALALIPAIGQTELSVVIGYLLMFSIGVMLSMMAFGLGLGSLQGLLKQRYDMLFYWSRRVIALASTVLGCFWLYQAV